MSNVWNEILALEYTSAGVRQAKTSLQKTPPVLDKGLYLHEEDRCKTYTIICIYSVLDYSVHRSLLETPSVQFLNKLSEKALVTKNSRSFQNKNMKSIHTELTALNLYHFYTIYGDLSSCLRFDIHQRKAWIRVGPPSRSESQNLIKILRKFIQVILQTLWKERFWGFFLNFKYHPLILFFKFWIPSTLKLLIFIFAEHLVP